MQAFVQHMPDFDVARQGMPRSYAELGMLIQQLSLCCAQLGVAGLSGVPSSVLHLQNDVSGQSQLFADILQCSIFEMAIPVDIAISLPDFIHV